MKMTVEESMAHNLEAFINQGKTGNSIKYGHYINYYKGLNVKTSFGQTDAMANVPWISIRGEGQQTSKGIYVSVLYFRKNHILAICYGISEENRPNISWNLPDKIDTIETVFKKNNYGKPYRYGQTLVYKIYHDNNLNFQQIVSDIDYLIDVYKNILQFYGIAPEAKFEAPDPQKRGKKKEFFDESYSINSKSNPTPSQVTIMNLFSIDNIIDSINSTGLIYSPQLIKRFAYSLLTKPFVILSGLSGSGKTQLAIAFAKALIKDDSQLCVVPVGADWTNREPLLGYPNALDNNSYVRPESGVLDLLIEANKAENSKKPYFLILDEMNLSYVERYFADFLSAMESHMEIHLWNGKDSKTPESVTLSKNVFIIGTINVDETTYMFSPKVLDRASVIEFKVSEEEMKTYLAETRKVDSDLSKTKASSCAEDFVKKAGEDIQVNDGSIGNILVNFFKELKKANAEFGYRTASEIYRFLGLATKDSSMTLDEAVDSAIIQKLLPKLHGSRKKIVPVLEKLWMLCEPGISLDKLDSLEVHAATKYKLSADKILRMYKSALDNGFTSFAEA